MKQIALSIIAVVCLLAVSVAGAGAQTVVGQRDYFESVGASAVSANTISHFTFKKPTSMYVDPGCMTSVQLPADALVLRTLIGVNKYKLQKGTLVYNNLFLFAVESAKQGWDCYIPFSFSTKDAEGRLVAQQYYLLRWSTSKLELALPSEADVTVFEVKDGQQGQPKNFHARVAFSTKAVTIGDEVLECVSLFADKMLGKQFDKTGKLESQYRAHPGGSKTEEVLAGTSLAPSLNNQ